MKRRNAKRRIAALALALLAFPATALAAPQDLRHEAPSSSLGVPPEVASPPVQSQLPALGTDVAAADQQSSVQSRPPALGTDVAAVDQQSSPPGVAVLTQSASDDGGFDWADAGIGAAGAASLLGISLAGALVLRRRPSALAG